MAIPDDVRETVLRRVRRLDRCARTIVLRASVIGARFDLAVLAATVDADEAAIRAALDAACQLQLLVAEPGGERWSFRHALTRDIVYAEVGGSTMRALHRRIVRVLEHRIGDEASPLHDVAYHAWAAGDVPRGVRYNERAGDRAVALHAHDDARMHYGRARSLTALGSRAFARLSEKLRALDVGVGAEYRTTE